MAEIEHVRARPGGLVTLRVDARGHATRPLRVRGYADLVFQWVGVTGLIGLFPSFVPVWWAGTRGLEGGEAMPYFLPLIVFFAAVVIGGLYFGAGEILGAVLLHAALALLVVCFPLLLIPRVRWWARRSVGSQDDSSAAVARERRRAAGFREPVRMSLVSHARVTRRGRRVTVTLHHVDGSTVDYSARGRNGEYLRAVFRDHLDGRFHEGSVAARTRPV